MYVFKQNENYVWEISILDDYLYKHVIVYLKKRLQATISLKSYKNTDFMVCNIHTSFKAVKEFAYEFYNKQASYKLDVSVLSPIAFKVKGDYHFIPDIRLILQSAMTKYQNLIEDSSEIDQEFLDELVKSVRLTNYQIKSSYYRVHQHLIPGFLGRLTLHLSCNQTLKNYIYMLLYFCEYSGVGIKTGMGMGKIQVTQREEKEWKAD